MADEVQPVDWWGVLEEAEQTVEQWPAWQQRYEADVYSENDAEPGPARAHAPVTRGFSANG
ncbi:MAG TPA: hypothetical protein VEK11_05295 [Thermoanaerobaculia bacterium]|jgi:hypothetical protein|nr:hypothetical protein [Thermoanaerobaculia bacterium]